MSEPAIPLENALEALLRRIIREEIHSFKAELNGHEPPALLSVERAAELFDVPKSWIAEAARRGELPSVRLGHYVRFQEKDLADFVRQRKNGKKS